MLGRSQERAYLYRDNLDIMRINSISFNHHKVFGDNKVNFFADSEALPERSLSGSGTDILIDADHNADENYYTFIIGDNGVGKSVLFRNIIHFANSNNYEDEPRLDHYIDAYKYNSKYAALRQSDQSHSELLSLNVYNKYFRSRKEGEFDFLRFFKAQLIFINGSYEKGIIHKNDRFRSFNYSSDINDTKNLFLNAFARFKDGDDQKLNALGSLLGNEKMDWKLRCGLSISASTVKSEADGRSLHVLSNTNGVNIFNFLRLIQNIRFEQNGKYIVDQSGDLSSAFDVLYNNGAFFKLYFNTGLLLPELFEKIKLSNIIARIEEFLLENVEAKDVESHRNIRVTDKQKAVWDLLFTEADELPAFDALLLGMLSSMNLLRIRINGDGHSIDTMSSGQKNLIRLFSYFADMPVPEELNNCLIFFDEPENSLHPRWQQEFPQNFRNIVDKVYGITGSHFIFATHSPGLLMRSAQLPNANVLRFFKDDDGRFHSELVKNVSAFSIEEVLLDEFKVAYRNQGAEDAMHRILDAEFDKRTRQQDPIDAIEKSFDLRDKINQLFNDLNKE